MIRVTCGVPTDHCRGSLISLQKSSCKAHATSQEAFECYAAWLLARGYRRLNRREFVLADGPILVLRKMSHFGRPLRMGKTGEGMAKAKRFTARGKPGHRAIVVI